MKTTIDLIREHPFAQGLEARHLSLLAACATDISVPGGHWLIREGEPADAFYLIRYGTVQLEMSVAGSESMSFMTVKSGEILGVNWISPPYRYAFDVRSIGPVSALKIDAVCLRKTCESDHEFGYELMKRFLPPLVDRLRLARFQCAQLRKDSR